MEIRKETGDGVNIYYLSGRFDAHQVSKVREAVDIQGNVIIDLEGVGFMDSSGLATLVAFTKKARANDSTLTIRKPQAAVKLTLEITQLDKVLPLES